MAKKANKNKTSKKVNTIPDSNEIEKKEEVTEVISNKKEKKESKKSSKDKRHFWKDFKAELKKVVWPTPKQLLNNTMAVIVIVVIVAAIVLVLDLSFEALNKYGINNIKKIVEGMDNNVTNSQTNTTEETNTAEEPNEVVENNNVEQ